MSTLDLHNTFYHVDINTCSSQLDYFQLGVRNRTCDLLQAHAPTNEATPECKENLILFQWSRRESNPQPSTCKADTLPIELRPQI